MGFYNVKSAKIDQFLGHLAANGKKPPPLVRLRFRRRGGGFLPELGLILEKLEWVSFHNGFSVFTEFILSSLGENLIWLHCRHWFGSLETANASRWTSKFRYERRVSLCIHLVEILFLSQYRVSNAKTHLGKCLLSWQIFGVQQPHVEFVRLRSILKRFVVIKCCFQNESPFVKSVARIAELLLQAGACMETACYPTLSFVSESPFAFQTKNRAKLGELCWDWTSEVRSRQWNLNQMPLPGSLRSLTIPIGCSEMSRCFRGNEMSRSWKAVQRSQKIQKLGYLFQFRRCSIS